MKKIMAIFGTRPEAIKLAPVINELKTYGGSLKPTVCVTAQHRQMLDQVLEMFKIVPDFDLNAMTHNQDLFGITIKCLEGLKTVLLQDKPDMILVQGDTTTTFAASLAAFYLKIPIGHVEAGLRTYDKYQPFPEEKNRHMATALADWHFAPTESARLCLVRENVPQERIWVTGNTSIDALLSVAAEQQKPDRQKMLAQYFDERWDLKFASDRRRLILVTGHRRESFGEGFKSICMALREIARNNPDVDLVYPVHMNPNVRKPVFDILGNCAGSPFKQGNVYLIDPLDYEPFVYLMCKSYLILTDSGGIQEEAPSLGKPVLVLRTTTERPEGIEAGNSKLVGTDFVRIVGETETLLRDRAAYELMASKKNPYGDGAAASRIVGIIANGYPRP
jgi:UDP-N-acetylglucosamine 2-epimerase (non-hydrolysing)